MVSNVSFARDGIKYVQGAPVVAKEASVLSETVGAAGSAALFGGINLVSPVVKNIKNGREAIWTALTTAPEKAATEVIKEGGKKGLFATIKGAATSALHKIPGFTKLSGTSVGKAFGKAGAGFMIAIDGAIETFTQIIPAFKQLGVKEGVTQIGKSALKVGAYAGGYVAGAAAGAKIGAAIGAAGGPLGAAIGMACGIIGGALFSGIAKKLTGKSASEKIAEKQEKEQAQQIAQDPQAMAELKEYVNAKIQEEQATGKVSKDTQKMVQELEAMNGSTTTNSTLPIFGTATNTAPSFGTLNSAYAVPTDKRPQMDFQLGLVA